MSEWARGEAQSTAEVYIPPVKPWEMPWALETATVYALGSPAARAEVAILRMP